jgi:hypothetical protein
VIPDNPAPHNANALRQINAKLDETLLRLVARAEDGGPPGPAEPEWSIGQVAAHLAEFPHFFAAHLRRWHSNRSTVVGRTHDDPGRLAAVSEGASAQLSADLVTSLIRDAFEDLAQAMKELSDLDLQATTINVKYGEEPLAAYLDRYVIEHKAGHIAQLERLLSADNA